jgi:hypothetical protein
MGIKTPIIAVTGNVLAEDEKVRMCLQRNSHTQT